MQKKVYYMIGRLGDSHGSTDDEGFAMRFLKYKPGRSVQVLEGETKELKLTEEQLKVVEEKWKEKAEKKALSATKLTQPFDLGEGESGLEEEIDESGDENGDEEVE